MTWCLLFWVADGFGFVAGFLGFVYISLFDTG